MTKKKVLMAVTNDDRKLAGGDKKTGYYLPEAAHPYDAFVEAGFEVDWVSPKGGVSPCDEGSVEAFKEDPSCKAFEANEAVQAALKATKSPDNVNPGDYSIYCLVGGHGPMFDVATNEPLGAIAAAIYEAGGVVGAVCHGPAGLLTINVNGEPLIKGKKVTCFSNSEEEAVGLTKAMPFLLEDALKAKGADYVAAADWSNHVQSDRRVVTGQNPASASSFGKACVEALSS